MGIINVFYLSAFVIMSSFILIFYINYDFPFYFVLLICYAIAMANVLFNIFAIACL
jgi:hypothetical protein